MIDQCRCSQHKYAGAAPCPGCKQEIQLANGSQRELEALRRCAAARAEERALVLGAMSYQADRGQWVLTEPRAALLDWPELAPARSTAARIAELEVALATARSCVTCMHEAGVSDTPDVGLCFEHAEQLAGEVVAVEAVFAQVRARANDLRVEVERLRAALRRTDAAAIALPPVPGEGEDG